MSKYKDQFDNDTIEAGKRFINRIRNKTLKKAVQPNSSPEYPIQKAAESFDALIKSEQFKNLLTE